MEKLLHLSLPGEQWVYLEGTEEKYAVSDKGRIASFWKVKPIILRPHPCKNGYLKVIIYYPAGERCMMPHRLVALHHVENPDQKPEVNHKDGVKTNNQATNLEWATRGENVRHQVANGLFNGWKKGDVIINRHRGERSPTAILNADQVRQIRLDRAAGLTHRVLAEKYGVKMSTISSAISCWKHIL